MLLKGHAFTLSILTHPAAQDNSILKKSGIVFFEIRRLPVLPQALLPRLPATADRSKRSKSPTG